MFNISLLIDFLPYMGIFSLSLSNHILHKRNIKLYQRLFDLESIIISHIEKKRLINPCVILPFKNKNQD